MPTNDIPRGRQSAAEVEQGRKPVEVYPVSVSGSNLQLSEVSREFLFQFGSSEVDRFIK